MSTVDLPSQGLPSPHTLLLKSRTLHIAHNQLASLLTLPKSLAKLYAYNNQLTALPALPDSLTELDVAHNQLASLPTLPESLTRLCVANNQLALLPDLPECLTTLDVANNQLASLPNLPESLRYIRGSGNPWFEGAPAWLHQSGVGICLDMRSEYNDAYKEYRKRVDKEYPGHMERLTQTLYALQNRGADDEKTRFDLDTVLTSIRKAFLE